MGELKIENREVVVPGEVLATGMDYLPSYGTYRKDDQIVASQLGLARLDGKVIKVIKLSGAYMPKINDTVIAKVIDVLMSGWRVDLGCAYSAVLPLKDASSRYIARNANLREFIDMDEYIVVTVTNVTSQKLIDVSMRGPGLMQLEKGQVFKVNCNKVPRIIGKQGSMVSMIKQHTNCKIIVGQNGYVWISGEPEKEVLAVKAIKKIEKESHIEGLTDRIKVFLEKGE
jgi:exosome complex component RRP4